MTDTILHPSQEGALVPKANLRDLQNMAVMGELAEAVAHDFNNIVSATLIHLSLLLQDPQLTAGQKDSLQLLELETARAAGLTRQLLSFSRRRFASKSESVDLNKLIQGIEKLLNHLVRENVSLSFQPTREECWINADIGQIEKLVMSLCLVIRQAMPRGGNLLLKTSIVRYDQVPRTSGASVDGELVCLAVSGTEKVVRPQRNVNQSVTDDETVSWDWKLDVARQIAQKHDGWVETMKDTGALELRFSIPLARDYAQASQNAASPGEIRGGTETILLVEDEDFLRRVSTLSLRKLGYAVLDAANNEAALKQWEKHQAKIDLVITDLLLPGSESGFDLALFFTSQKPSVRVMLSSGDHADLDECSRRVARPFFPALKPYTASRLAQMVRECLDASG